MFTKEDLINYLSDIQTMETNMRDTYAELFKMVDDPEVKKVFLALKKAEESHKGIVEELRKKAIQSNLSD